MTDQESVAGRRALRAPAAERNREPILAELRQLLPAAGRVLEIASGTGQHVVFFAEHLPDLHWQPSDVDPVGLESVTAYVTASQLPNLRAPLVLDVCAADWGVELVDAIYCCNMIHIAPWSCTEGLFAGAARVLTPEGILLTYGPYRFDGVFTAPSNEAFDESLRARDPSWGVRDTTDIQRVATAHGFDLERAIAMPANNHILVFRRARSQ